jgi:hypothetical protein
MSSVTKHNPDVSVAQEQVVHVNRDGYAGAPSPVNGSPFLNALATRTRRTSDSEDIQERRSFEYFRCELSQLLVDTPGLQHGTSKPAVSQAAIALGVLHERLSISSLEGTSGIKTDFPIRKYTQAPGELRKYLSAIKGS